MSIMTTKTRIGRKTAFWMGLTCSFLLIFTPSAKAKDVEIKVGIVQRFGEEVTDKVSIASNSGDSLTLRFVDQNGQPQTLQTNQLTLEIVKQPLSNPVLEERLVLSDHATFETAEDSAKQWEALGIEVEVTQPERWQVWAKRDVYQTPLLRRWLHQSLKAKGYKDPYLETALVSQKPQASFTINGVRYGLNKLDITTGTNQVRVTKPGQQPRLYGGVCDYNRIPMGLIPLSTKFL